ncbi:hypothetical protein M378DRAFT_155657 [Amanita muscaria Koide BX008]|uniref:EamA domain-containing protein n=1 Tax=Amanita muscaria (strain Koide BX008) TaxID=946122 RepID=A0A0C2TTS6_AMAMK|nr:hypothetical protein M378DRAFT_155657 [Amanita muscaria Koide BX008]
MDAASQHRIGYMRDKLRAFVTATLNRDFLSGIIILLVVVFLWTASNFLTQDIYDGGYEKPFLVTYLSTSSFVLYLFPYCAHRWWKVGHNPEQNHLRQGPELQPLTTSTDADELIDEEHATPVIARGSSSRAVLPPLTTKETANLAMAFCVLWFIANWSLNASLVYTTAASAMILSSTSGFFTLGIGRILRVEALTRTKILAVVLSFSGVVLVYISDSRQKQPTASTTANGSYHPVLGDFLGLTSALFYAFYVILLKIRIGSESRIDMRLFFGFVGLFNILFAWPVALLLHLIGIETLEWPSTRNAVIALLVNTGITFSSDYLYVIAMLKTTPLVVTVGLSLTIPFAVVGDILLGHTIYTQVILGAMLVMFSFVAVGIDSSSVDY